MKAIGVALIDLSVVSSHAQATSSMSPSSVVGLMQDDDTVALSVRTMNMVTPGEAQKDTLMATMYVGDSLSSAMSLAECAKAANGNDRKRGRRS